jgi:hypothetical protein
MPFYPVRVFVVRRYTFFDNKLEISFSRLFPCPVRNSRSNTSAVLNCPRGGLRSIQPVLASEWPWSCRLPAESIESWKGKGAAAVKNPKASTCRKNWPGSSSLLHEWLPSCVNPSRPQSMFPDESGFHTRNQQLRAHHPRRWEALEARDVCHSLYVLLRTAKPEAEKNIPALVVRSVRGAKGHFNLFL